MLEDPAPLTKGWRSPTETIALEATDADETPLVLGDDGDDTGKLTTVKFRVDGNGDTARTLMDLALRDLLDCGHGFIIQTLAAEATTEWRLTCEVCGDPLVIAADEWFCELEGIEPEGPFRPASVTCECNWCLHHQTWLQMRYRPQGGRPAKRCGKAECKRKAACERKRKSRAARKDLHGDGGVRAETSAEHLLKDVLSPKYRKPKGEHADPTADIAIALITYGDELIPIVKSMEDPTVIAVTTYRREFYGEKAIRRPSSGVSQKPPTSRGSSSSTPTHGP